MELSVWVIGATVALLAGLDRTAVLQVMISRPLVVGPFVGWLLGVPGNGLLIGALIELLWLARMPVGAAIPPDDTQVAVAATCLTVLLNQSGNYADDSLVICALLLAMPLGKVGQWFERLARTANARLQRRADQQISAGDDLQIETLHLRGILHFGLAAVATFSIILTGGVLLGSALLPHMVPLLTPSTAGLELLFPLVGTAVILVTLNVSRALTLFSTSFMTVLLTLWLL